MLSITKLGIEVLSKFARQKKEGFAYRGYVTHEGTPYFGHPAIPSKKVLAEGHLCYECHWRVSCKLYGWCWQDGLCEATFSSNDTFLDVISRIHTNMPNLTHVAIEEIHKDSNILWVYRYDKNRL